MTVIEFFSKTPLENIIGSITVDFNKIIFVGDNKAMTDFKPIYQAFAAKRDFKAEICYRGINKNNLPDIVEKLSEIIEQEDECFFDLTGGDNKETDTFNEIDVILLSGFKPIFISCKNGQVDDEELYKLETVANRFGGEKVKKVLIASYFGKQGDSKEHFVNRAKEMDIEFIEQVQKLDYAAFRGVVKQLVNS